MYIDPFVAGVITTILVDWSRKLKTAVSRSSV